MTLPRLALLIVVTLLQSCALTPSVYYPLKREYVEATEVLAGSLVVQGIQDYQSGRLDLALKRFQEAEALLGEKTSASLQRNLSVAFLRAGFPEESLEYMKELSKQLQDSLQVIFDKANAYAAAGEFKEAENLYKEALELSFEDQDFAGSAGIARALARLYFEYGYEQEAACAAWLAFSLNPVAPEVPLFTAILLATGNFEALALELQSRFPPPNFGGSAEVAWALALSSLGTGELDKYRVYSARARQLLHPEEVLETEILATNQLLFGPEWVEQELAAIEALAAASGQDKVVKKDRKKEEKDESEDDGEDPYADLRVEDPKEALRYANPLELPPAVVLLLQEEDGDEGESDE